LLFHHGNQAAPHDLGVDLSERRVGTSDHESSLVAGEFNIAEPVYACVEERTDDGRRLVLRDHGRTADARSGREIRPPMNRNLLELAGIRVEDRPPRGGFRLARPLSGWRAKLAFRWGPHRDHPT